MSDYYDEGSDQWFDPAGDPYEDDGLGDELEEVSYSPPGLPYLEALGREADEAGLTPAVDTWRALEDERQRADEFWAEREARRQYEAYVDEVELLAEGQEIAQELAERYGREYAVSASVGDGSLLALADQLHNAAEWEAYNSGNEERLAHLRSPEGAQDTIELAAALRSIHAFAGHAWKPSDRATLRRLNPDWVARARDDFEQMERRKNRGEFSGL